MFRSILKHIGVGELEAPVFHHYLNRHVHLDEDFHAPISLRLLDELCEGRKERVLEAERAANLALEERILFWDGVLAAITLN